MNNAKEGFRWITRLVIASLGLALVVFFVLARPHYDADAHAWRYHETRSSTDVPSAVVQMSDFTPDNVTRTLVTGGLDDVGPAWLSLLPTNMDHVYYPVLRDPETYTNKGHEAMFYLRYIVDNYDALPNFMVFVHNHKRAWHNSDVTDRSILHLLTDLRWDFVAQEGFVNLRCQSKPNCPSILPLSGFVRAGKMENFFERAWEDVFEDEFGPLGQIAATCCAQFAVTREAVHGRPREFYRSLVAWLERSGGTDWQLGRVLEYTWHILFGKDPIHCPDADVCRANLYGYRTEEF